MQFQNIEKGLAESKLKVKKKKGIIKLQLNLRHKCMDFLLHFLNEKWMTEFLFSNHPPRPRKQAEKTQKFENWKIVADHVML